MKRWAGSPGPISVVALVLHGLMFCGACRDDAAIGPAASQPVGRPVERTAEQGPVRLTVRVDREIVTAPETVTMTVAVEAERGVEVELPDHGPVLGGFLVRGLETAEGGDDTTLRREQIVTLESVVPGRQEIPPIVARFVDRRPTADGTVLNAEGEVACPAIPVTVHSALADVRGPVTLARRWPWTVMWWALGLAAVVAAIVWVVRRRRRRPVMARAAARRTVEPHEWALAELDRLLAEDLIGSRRVQEFYYRINGLVRRYIELRYGITAAEQTSEEFVRSVQESALLRDGHRDLLRRFTEACDPVKYARHRPGPGDIDWVRDTARNFIVETAPASGGGPGDEDASRRPQEIGA